MRVLYCVGGGIGNVVMSTPAAAALLRLGFEVSMYLQPEAEPAAELLRGWGALQSVITGPPPAPEHFDLAVHTVWSRRRDIHPDERSPGRVDLRNMHEAEANMIPVRALGYAGPLPPAHVETGKASHHGAHGAHGDDRLLPVHPLRALCDLRGECRCPYLVFAPGCNADPFWDRKRWGGWRELAERLDSATVILDAQHTNQNPQHLSTGIDRISRIGTSASKPFGQSCPSCTSLLEVVDLTGRTTLAEAAAVIAGARAVIAIDNGLAHVAAALGVPTVVLFGATSETKNRPLGPRVRLLVRRLPCRPCQMTPRWEACSEWQCMGIPAGKVAEAVEGMVG